MPLLCVATLNHVDGLTEHAFVNTFAVRTEAVFTPLQALDACVEVIEFYTTAKGAQPAAVGTFLSTAVTRTPAGCLVEAFDLTGALDGSPHGSPIAAQLFGMPNATAGGDFPAEVAVAATLEAEGRTTAAVEAPDSADPGTAVDRPKQRHTGRIYIGPLRTPAASSTLLGRVPVDAAFAASVGRGLVELNTSLAALVGIVGLGVWSRRDAAMRALDRVTIDDAFDTQRRRGEKATARTAFDV